MTDHPYITDEAVQSIADSYGLPDLDYARAAARDALASIEPAIRADERARTDERLAELELTLVEVQNLHLPRVWLDGRCGVCIQEPTYPCETAQRLGMA